MYRVGEQHVTEASLGADRGYRSTSGCPCGFSVGLFPDPRQHQNFCTLFPSWVLSEATDCFFSIIWLRPLLLLSPSVLGVCRGLIFSPLLDLYSGEDGLSTLNLCIVCIWLIEAPRCSFLSLFPWAPDSEYLLCLLGCYKRLSTNALKTVFLVIIFSWVTIKPIPPSAPVQQMLAATRQWLF